MHNPPFCTSCNLSYNNKCLIDSSVIRNNVSHWKTDNIFEENCRKNKKTPLSIIERDGENSRGTTLIYTENSIHSSQIRTLYSLISSCYNGQVPAMPTAFFCGSACCSEASSNQSGNRFSPTSGSLYAFRILLFLILAFDFLTLARNTESVNPKMREEKRTFF